MSYSRYLDLATMAGIATGRAYESERIRPESAKQDHKLAAQANYTAARYAGTLERITYHLNTAAEHERRAKG